MRLLKEMQGMDSVFRQTGQHMEYEPEWESAFNLHIKLAHVITLVLEWCGTDQVVLVKVYRMVMANLDESEFILAQTRPEFKELANHSTSTLMYDVLSKHVSIHLPLSRFFAGIYLHMLRFGYTFETIMGASTKLTPEELIEPVLCTQTMIAQVHAGLWRRNGYSLLNQLYFYRNVKCRGEMLDRDVVMLQIGGSLIEANEFLIHIISKFNLMAWAAPDFEQQKPEEDGIRQTINMLDEMLELLIMVLGERHMPGVSAVDESQRLRKELIQQLCIKPHSHSELSKTLNESQHADAEEIIRELATFDKPTARSGKKGVYVLRPEFYDEYNMFYYHYTKEEKSRAEETHRARRKEAKLLDCCPPPKLPRLCSNFETLVCVLNCDVMLLVMQTVLKRSLDLKARHFAESHLQKVLHLIGYALHEEASGEYPFFTFVQRAHELDLLPMLQELVDSARVEVHRDLLVWTVRKFEEMEPEEVRRVRLAKAAVEMEVESGESKDDVKTLTAVADATMAEAGGDNSVEMIATDQRKSQQSLDPNVDATVQQSHDQSPAANKSAVSATATTTPVQSSTGVATAALTAAEIERIEKENRQRLAAERRAKIMAQMKSAQTSFMTSNAEMFKKSDTDTATSTSITSASDGDENVSGPVAADGHPTSSASMDWQQEQTTNQSNASMLGSAGSSISSSGRQRPTINACLGPIVSARLASARPPLSFGNHHNQQPAHEEYTCILCSEDVVVDRSSPCMVYSAFVQTSKVMAQANNQGMSPHVNSCGHVMHAACWDKYFENEALKETRRPNRTRAPGTFHIDKKEFLCPLCRCLSNVVLPVPTSLRHYAAVEAEAVVVKAGEEDQMSGECGECSRFLL